MCWYGRRNKKNIRRSTSRVHCSWRHSGYLHCKCAVPVVPGWSGTGCFHSVGRSCCTVCRRIADGWIYGIPDRGCFALWRCIRRRFFHDEPLVSKLRPATSTRWDRMVACHGVFGKLHPKFRTPYIAILTVGIISSC